MPNLNVIVSACCAGAPAKGAVRAEGARSATVLARWVTQGLVSRGARRAQLHLGQR